MESVAVVDGANIAYVEESQGGKPKVSNLIAVRKALMERGIIPIIIVDASLRYKVDDPNQLEALIQNQDIRQSPAAADADYFILAYADELGASVISNDEFDQYQEEGTMKLRLFCFSIIIFLMCVCAENNLCFATEEYAKRTGKVCAFCHQRPHGGPLNPMGIAYIRNNYTYPVPESILNKSHTLSTPIYRTIRLIMGYIHLAAACILIGTIFYVHLFVKPTSLRGGIPKGERILGLVCLNTLLGTGLYLTWYRLDSLAAFFQSHFGILLLTKLILFVIMQLMIL